MTGPFVVKELEPCAKCGGKGTVVKNGPSELEYDSHYPCSRCTVDRTSSLRGTGTRVVSVKAFETLPQLRRALAGEDYLDLEGLAGMPDATRADIEAAQAGLETLIRDGRLPLPDGREITVEQTSYEAVLAALPPLQRPNIAEWTDVELIEAFNAFMAERYAAQAGRA